MSSRSAAAAAAAAAVADMWSDLDSTLRSFDGIASQLARLHASSTSSSASAERGRFVSIDDAVEETSANDDDDDDFAEAERASMMTGVDQRWLRQSPADSAFDGGIGSASSSPPPRCGTIEVTASSPTAANPPSLLQRRQLQRPESTSGTRSYMSSQSSLGYHSTRSLLSPPLLSPPPVQRMPSTASSAADEDVEGYDESDCFPTSSTALTGSQYGERQRRIEKARPAPAAAAASPPAVASAGAASAAALASATTQATATAQAFVRSRLSSSGRSSGAGGDWTRLLAPTVASSSKRVMPDGSSSWSSGGGGVRGSGRIPTPAVAAAAETSADNSSTSRGGTVAASRGSDDVDYSKPPVFKTPAGAPGASTVAATSGTSTIKRAPSALRKPSAIAKPTGGSSSGSVDEDNFAQSFDQVPKVAIYSTRDVEDKLATVQATLSDPNEDWEKRVTALKTVRAIVLACGTESEELLQAIRQLDVSFQTSVKDLRSQVVREACVTIAFLARNFAIKFERSAEMLVVHLVNLIPNSAKIMATSGSVALRFIIQHVHSPRLIPLITQQLSSKASQIRRHICEVLELMLTVWPTYALERHTALLQDAIKRAVGDADADARSFARRAFWAFASHFKDQADALYDSLDAVRQKQLQGELSASSSGNSIATSAVSTPSSASAQRGATASASLGSAARSRSQEREAAIDGVDDTDAAGGGMFVRGGSRRSDRRGLAPKSSGTNSLMGLARPRKSASGSASVTVQPGQQAAALSPDDGSARQIPRTSFSQRDHSLLPVPDAGSRSSSPATKLFASISAAGTNGQQQQLLQQQPSQQLQQQTLPGRRKSGIPRSQGASRESSPSRSSSGQGVGGFDRGVTGRLSLTSSAQPRRVPAAGSALGGGGHSPSGTMLQSGRDAEELLAQKLRGSMRRRFDAGGGTLGLAGGGAGSDDDASETSSVCSETLSTFGGRVPEDVGEIIANMSSSHWSERKEGLLQLQYFVVNVRHLNKVELKKVTEIFTRMFYDPHNKVFSVFMDTLVEVITMYRADLKDWLYTLLTRLLTKCGIDMLASVASKVYRSLDVTREAFDNVDQFQALTKFMIDQTQTPNLKVKLQLLNYMHALVGQMDSAEFVSNADSKLALSKIITWVGEPKSAEIRRAAQVVLLALFNLNTAEFSSLLSGLPKAFQEGATKVLQSSMQGSDVTGSPGLSHYSADGVSTGRSPVQIGGSRVSPLHKLPTSQRYRMPSDVEMNAEDVYHSIRKTTQDIESLSLNSKTDSDRDAYMGGGGRNGGGNGGSVRERDSASQDSGIQSSLPDVRVDSPDAPLSYHGGGGGSLRKGYNPVLYQDGSRHNGGPLYTGIGGRGGGGDDGDLASEELPMDPSDSLANIVVELSNHDRRSKERQAALLQLVTLTREGTLTHWDEHFKTVLLLLLETLGDDDGNIRANALRALREIVKHQRHRFEGYAELTILKILDAHKDPCRDVVVVAEDCASTLAQSLAPEHCVRVLCQISQSDEYPVNLAAIKMETKVIELLSKAAVEKHIADMVPGLLKGYSHNESTVRKASVFALVALYMHVGERLKDHLSELNSSKIKLLNVYISRAMNKKSGVPSGVDGGDVV